MKDTSKVLTVALASRVLVVVVMVVCSVSFAYVTTANMNVHDMNVPFIGMFMRWDSEHYLAIAKTGYPLGYPDVKSFPATTGTGSPMPPKVANDQWAFFPLYPALMSILSYRFLPLLSKTPSLMLSGVIISNIAFFFSAYFFYKLTQKLFNSKLALVSTACYCFWVGGVFYSTIYTEALFMALALGAFYYLTENKLPLAVFLGFLAAFTRSDGFLIFIPFLVYGLQQLRTSKMQSVKLFASSALVASPYLLFNVAGYFLAGGVFPVQLIARESNWGIYPLLVNQFGTVYCSNPTFEAFDAFGLMLILAPTLYFILNPQQTFTVEAKTLGFWGYYAAMVYVVLTDAVVSNVWRYAVPMLPVYWVLGKVYMKNRLVGALLFAVITVLLVVAAYLFETANPNFM